MPAALPKGSENEVSAGVGGTGGQCQGWWAMLGLVGNARAGG